MNKSDLVEKLYNRCRVTRQGSSEIVDLFFSEVIQSLIECKRVEIRGFCSFSIKEYHGYFGRNPKTGEKIQVAPKKLPFFKCGKELKERVNFLSN